MMKRPLPMTADGFDRLTSPRHVGIIWTADAIGKRIGRSAAYVRRTLAKMPGTPIHRHGGGNLFVDEMELAAFMRKTAP